VQNDDKAYYTDAQLCRRWHCSTTTLWRMRTKGVLPSPFKLGGGKNLTAAEHVRRAEQPPITDEEAA
jgi:hypothetical protein